MNVQRRVHKLRTTKNINSSSTRSHASEEENRTGNRSKNCKCKRASTVSHPSCNLSHNDFVDQPIKNRY